MEECLEEERCEGGESFFRELEFIRPVEVFAERFLGETEVEVEVDWEALRIGSI